MINTYHKVHWMTQVVFWIAMAILIICGLGIIIPCLSISESNLVLTFIGVLATFVVINNYAQIIEVKKDTDNRLKVLEDKMVESNIFDSAYKKEVEIFIRMKLQELLRDTTKPLSCTIKDYHMTDDNFIIARVTMPKRELRPGSNNAYNVSTDMEEKVFVVDMLNNIIKEAK